MWPFTCFAISDILVWLAKKHYFWITNVTGSADSIVSMENQTILNWMTFWMPLLVYKYLLGENSSAVAATGDDWWWDQMPPSCIYDTQKGKMNAPKRTLALIARFLHVSSVIFALPNKVYKVLPETNYTQWGLFYEIIFKVLCTWDDFEFSLYLRFRKCLVTL